MLDAFGSCRLCLVEIEGRAGTPASCTTPVAAGMVVHTQSERLAPAAQGRDGALHLRPLRRLPDLRGQRRLRAAGHGRGSRACATCATAMTATTTCNAGIDDVQPLFQFRSGQMHRLLALRARLRGGPGHFRADHRRPRLRLHGRRRAWTSIPRIRVRLLRRLRAGLPDRIADREDRSSKWASRSIGSHDLRLLRRRLRLQGGDARRRSGPHGARTRTARPTRPFLRQGPLRLGLRQSPGPHPQADAAREDHRPVARGVVGTRRSAASPPSSSASRRQYGGGSIGGITSSRCTDEETYLVQKLVRAGLRQQQRRYLRPRLPFADRLRPEHDVRHLCRHAGFRFGRATPTSSWSSAPIRPTGTRCSPRA